MDENQVSAFLTYFRLFPADTIQLQKECLKLRYQVYCVETGFESIDTCAREVNPDGSISYYETDDFDRRSIHYLIQHRASKAYAATVRLILADENDPTAPFPIEQHFRIERDIEQPEFRKTLAEVSRFAVSKDFKRRAGEPGTLAGTPDVMTASDRREERRMMLHLSMGLVAGLVKMSRDRGIEWWLAAMEPALYRLLTKYGIQFDQIGPAEDYHGERIPCIINVHDMLGNVRVVNYPTWQLITSQCEVPCD